MNRLVFLTVLLVIPAVSSALEPSMALYQDLLTDYVEPGTHHGTLLNWVNYTELGKDPKFNELVHVLEDFSPHQLKDDKEKIAFYINAYNIFAIKVVLDNWPVKSIKDIGSFLKPVWKKKTGIIGGKQISLDEIEHKILRPLGDPRIHMAIVCASISCPDLRMQPYAAKILDGQLDNQTKIFLSNPAKGLIVEDNEIKISKIFDWFEKDFIKTYGSVKLFISHYSDLSVDDEIKTRLSYNWSLNGQ